MGGGGPPPEILACKRKTTYYGLWLYYFSRFARKNSFFNFFNPPVVPEPDHPQHQQKKDLLEAHIQIGLCIKVS